jgi:hypothetical protein
VKSLDSNPVKNVRIIDDFLQSYAHFLSRFVGKRDGQNLLGLDNPSGQQISYAMGQRPCLSGAWTSHDQKGTAAMPYRLLLRTI